MCCCCRSLIGVIFCWRILFFTTDLTGGLLADMSYEKKWEGRLRNLGKCERLQSPKVAYTGLER